MNKQSNKNNFIDVTNIYNYYFADQKRIHKYAVIKYRDNNKYSPYAAYHPDLKRMEVYKWERSCRHEAKILQKKTKPLSLEYCRKYLNKIIKHEFHLLWRRNPDNAIDSMYYGRHCRLIPKLTFNEILPLWKKGWSINAQADFKLYRKKGEKKTLLIDTKLFKKEYPDFNLKINNESLKDCLESEDWEEHEVNLTGFIDARMHGKKKVKITYLPCYCVMRLHEKARTKQTMLHELAHLLNTEYQGHNSSFLTILMYLYHKYLKMDYNMMYYSAVFSNLEIDEKHGFFESKKVTAKGVSDWLQLDKKK
ncbi:MAG: hypothetical protein CFH22_00710 [Alphaproteobacteria bacterium MarineAlpha5_Bin12]|nr:MAG: hypothetical protein CFH22_00710 [Alphaproteobacteria bacterium MarineAlpha5_Bin12]|tara:strand:+ start:1112 stop:2032 length:921 start_codon:yes stop_codon:yes gene_type:complete